MPDACRDGAAQFAERLALADPVGGIEVGCGERLRLDLVLARLVGAHGGDVQARMQPVGPEHRLLGRRGGDDELRCSDQPCRIRLRPCVDAEHGGDIGGASLRLGRIAPPDQRLPERPHQMRRRHLQPRLHAGADDAGRLHRRRCEMACGDRPGRSRAHVGQIAIVEQQRLDQAGPGGEQDHQPVEARQAELRIVEEAGADLDREPLEAGNIGGLDVDLAIGLRDRHRQDRRHHHASRGERGEGPLDDADRVEIEMDDPAQLLLRQHRHVMRHRPVPSPSQRRGRHPDPSRRRQTTACRHCGRSVTRPWARRAGRACRS